MTGTEATIVIRAHDEGTLAAEAIRSALNQDLGHRRHEVLVVEDGTDEATHGTVAAFDGRVRRMRASGNGPIDAANTGFRAAEGTVVMLLDADDVLDERFLRISSRTLDERRLDYVVTDYTELYPGGASRYVSTENPWSAISGCTLYRRTALAGAGYYAPGLVFPEYDVLLQNWERWQGGHIPEALMLYRRRRGSITSFKPNVARGFDQLRDRHPEQRGLIASIRDYAIGD